MMFTEKIYETKIATPIGPLILRTNNTALVEIKFSDDFTSQDNHSILSQARQELTEYFDGERTKFNIPIQLDGTIFQKKCWHTLSKVPYGRTISYKEQAIELGGPNYARAVAGANNKNKLPIIIPCHRVIGTNGSLVGYAGGIKIKRILLELELSKIMKKSARKRERDVFWHHTHKRENTFKLML